MTIMPGDQDDNDDKDDQDDCDEQDNCTDCDYWGDYQAYPLTGTPVSKQSVLYQFRKLPKEKAFDTWSA